MDSAQAQEFKRLTRQGGEIHCENGLAAGYDCLNMNLAGFVSVEDMGSQHSFAFVNDVSLFVIQADQVPEL